MSQNNHTQFADGRALRELELHPLLNAQLTATDAYLKHFYAAFGQLHALACADLDELEMHVALLRVNTSLMQPVSPDNSISINIENDDPSAQEEHISEEVLQSESETDHPAYDKYFRLHALGAPIAQLRLAMQADGLDSDVLLVKNNK